MERIKWGILGCGDVAEVKSGPAFQQCEHSELVAVMRRNANKAEDFAKRHRVSKWFNTAEELLNQQSINAVYIATPPAFHLEYTLQAIKAGKHIYLEKPMALSAKEAEKIEIALQNSSSKLTVAHYRRKLPAFLKVKELISRGEIGAIRLVDLKIFKNSTSKVIAKSEDNWRVNPEISGGGLFHDLAPHQLDLMYHYFGSIQKVMSFAENQSNSYQAADIVNGIMKFENGIQFRGAWCFTIAEESQQDNCVLYGSKGRIEFSFFGDRVFLKSTKGEKTFRFKNPPTIQQPMIQATIDYFLDKAENPCPVADGIAVMKLLDAFSR